jgi:hypothetical protein
VCFADGHWPSPPVRDEAITTRRWYPSVPISAVRSRTIILSVPTVTPLTIFTPPAVQSCRWSCASSLSCAVAAMKTLSLILIAMAGLATEAIAHPRPLSLVMSCGQARSLVASRGAIVLDTGRYTYDRYVSSQAFCLRNEYVRPAWVPTADTPQCPIGYTCVDDPPWFFDR